MTEAGTFSQISEGKAAQFAQPRILSAGRASTTDHLGLAPETLVLAAVWKGHCRMISKNRGKLMSSRHRPYDVLLPSVAAAIAIKPCRGLDRVNIK
jgi:hypothetical protein